ncbi:unnamed protein product [Phytomonas sp. EM1]|nr:unnamed protein product [Phytomonas sp. EM1]|eukprot:CCW63414.1 unnamed protein product [Phytomonas sp. isolate EM1]
MQRLLCNSYLRHAVPLHFATFAMHSPLTIPPSRVGRLMQWVSAPSMRCLSTSTSDGSIDGTMQAPTDPLPSETETLDKLIRGLSDEDQRLIYSALTDPESQKSSIMGGSGIGPNGSDMVAAFTCGRCEHRMVKKFSKHAYTRGIVIVECSECHVKHLLADNLGWIDDEARNIEDILREKGEKFIKIGGGDYQVLPKPEEGR